MSSVVERFPMQANFEGLIQLLAKNLYPEPDVFVRELIQNAHDSIRLRQEQEPGLQGRIEVEVRPDESLILFRDNGLGMDRDEIKRFLSVIGSTGTGTARERLRDADSAAAYSLIGQFGIGMLSAFVVAEHVVVKTRKLGASGAFAWHNAGSAECELRPSDEPQSPGSEIVVKVAATHRFMLDGERLQAAIVRFCDFIPFPIHNQFSLYLFYLRIQIRQLSEQTRSDLAEEGSYHHIELLQPCPLLSLLQYLVNDQCYQQHFDKNKGNVTQQIDEDMMGIPENSVVQNIETHRQHEQHCAQNNQPTPAFHIHVSFLRAWCQVLT